MRTPPRPLPLAYLAALALLLTSNTFAQQPLPDWKAAWQEAEAAWKNGHHSSAEKHFDRALDLVTKAGVPPIHLAEVSHRFGQFFLQRGKNEHAQHYLHLARRVRVRELGPGHPTIAPILDDLARTAFLGTRLVRPPIYSVLGTGDTRPNRGIAAHESRPFLSDPYPVTAQPEVGWRNAGMAAPNAAYAIRLYREALDIREAHLGPQHPDVAINLRNIALMELETGEAQRAADALARAVAIQESALAPNDTELAVTLEAYAKALHNLKRKDEARRHEKRARKIRSAARKPA